MLRYKNQSGLATLLYVGCGYLNYVDTQDTRNIQRYLIHDKLFIRCYLTNLLPSYLP